MRAEFGEPRVFEQGGCAIGVKGDHFLRTCDEIGHREAEKVEEVWGRGGGAVSLHSEGCVGVFEPPSDPPSLY